MGTEQEETCVGPCGRIFTLQTELQKQKGLGDQGWLCPLCRFNNQYKNILGYVEKKN